MSNMIFHRLLGIHTTNLNFDGWITLHLILVNYCIENLYFVLNLFYLVLFYSVLKISIFVLSTFKAYLLVAMYM